MNKTLNKIEQTVSVLLLISIVLLVFIAAVMRTIGLPIIWSVDFAQLFFAWLCMIGANQALRKYEHVGVDMFVRNLSWQVRIKIDLFIYILTAFALLILIIFGVKLVLLNPQRILGTTGLSYSLVTLALPVGAILMFNTTVIRCLMFVKLIGQKSNIIDTTSVDLPDYVKQLKKGSTT